MNYDLSITQNNSTYAVKTKALENLIILFAFNFIFD
jgi:hypothetical protein